MNKLTLTAAILAAMTATSVFAHHPSADMNPNYEEVDDQLEAVDSPHPDMDIGDMGATTAEGDSETSSETRAQPGWQSLQIEPSAAFDDDTPADAAETADTIDLLENVAR